MAELWAALLAGFISIAITLSKLFTTKYPRENFVLWKCWHVWIYGLAYCLISIGIFYLVQGDILPLDLSENSGLWVAIGVGTTTKAIMQTPLFSFNSMPIGIAAFVLPMEESFLGDLKHAVWVRVEDFIKPYAEAYPDLNQVQSRIRNNIDQLPLDDDAKAGLLSDIANCKDTRAAMWLLIN